MENRVICPSAANRAHSAASAPKRRRSRGVKPISSAYSTASSASTSRLLFSCAGSNSVIKALNAMQGMASRSRMTETAFLPAASTTPRRRSRNPAKMRASEEANAPRKALSASMARRAFHINGWDAPFRRPGAARGRKGKNTVHRAAGAGAAACMGLAPAKHTAEEAAGLPAIGRCTPLPSGGRLGRAGVAVYDRRPNSRAATKLPMASSAQPSAYRARSHALRRRSRRASRA